MDITNSGLENLGALRNILPVVRSMPPIDEYTNDYSVAGSPP